MKFVTSARGRVTVLGDHQDYLGLRVIASPINVGLTFEWNVKASPNLSVRIDSKPLGKIATIRGGESLKNDEFDLARACIQALERHGATLSGEVHVVVTGSLRPKSGLSSSAAFSIGFLRGLLRIATLDSSLDVKDPHLVPELAFEAEHDILGVPCGRLDQYTCNSDRPLFLEFTDPIKLMPLPFQFPLMVVDSLVPKSTEAIHVGIQKLLLAALKKIKGRASLELMKTMPSSEIIKHQDVLTPEELKAMLGVTRIRDCLVKIAAQLQNQNELDESRTLELLKKLGSEMFKEHEVLRNYLQVSHPALDEIVTIARQAGALGAKLTGAGKGGAVVVLLDPTSSDLSSRLKALMEQKGYRVLGHP